MLVRTHLQHGALFLLLLSGWGCSGICGSRGPESASRCNTGGCNSPRVAMVVPHESGLPGTYVMVPKSVFDNAPTSVAGRRPSATPDGAQARTPITPPSPYQGTTPRKEVATTPNPQSLILPPGQSPNVFTNPPAGTSAASVDDPLVQIPNVDGQPPSKPSRPAETSATASTGTATAPAPAPRASQRADDYSWIVGRLEYLNAKKVWRLRLVAPGIEDDLGVVTLLGVDHLVDTLKEGRQVKVEGVLVDRESKKPSPEYHVHVLKVME